MTKLIELTNESDGKALAVAADKIILTEPRAGGVGTKLTLVNSEVRVAAEDFETVLAAFNA
jgi:hypothetical protein